MDNSELIKKNLIKSLDIITGIVLDVYNNEASKSIMAYVKAFGCFTHTVDNDYIHLKFNSFNVYMYLNKYSLPIKQYGISVDVSGDEVEFNSVELMEQYVNSLSSEDAVLLVKENNKNMRKVETITKDIVNNLFVLKHYVPFPFYFGDESEYNEEDVVKAAEEYKASSDWQVFRKGLT